MAIKDFSGLLVEKYRPQTLEDIVLSKEDRVFFEAIKQKQEIPHLLFAGIQGTGKTSLAKIIVNDILDCQYLYINASDENGIDTIRGKISGFAKTRSLDGKLKVVLLDEGDQISLDAQKALRNIIEEFSLNTRFIITCNYLFKIIPPIQSRTQIINLSPPIDEILKRVKKILQKENISINQEQKNLLLAHIKKNVPDIRRIVNDIQKFSITGKLDIKTEAIDDFVKSLFSDIIKNTNLTNLRKKIIENEKLFSNDYRHLLKQMFEIVFRENIDQSKKAESLLILAKGMETDCIVVDKEINCFSTLIKLQQALVATT